MQKYNTKNYFSTIKNTRFTATPVSEVLDAPYCNKSTVWYTLRKVLSRYSFSRQLASWLNSQLDEFSRAITDEPLL